jgi:hypothetical protein
MLATKTGRRLVVAGTGALIVAGGAAGCGDLFGSDADLRDASLSFGVTENGTLLTASANGGRIVITGGGHTVDLQSADVVFSEVTFEGVGVEPGDDDDSDADSDSDHEGNARFRAGAVTVALPLQGGLITPFSGQVPPATYRGLEMDADFVRLRGTYDGQAFDVTVPVNAELELRFVPPLEVTSSGDPVNVSVNVDVSSWFRDSSGNTIDPRRLATDATLRAEFRDRVRASFRAFEDGDRDGDESDSDSDSR